MVDIEFLGSATFVPTAGHSWNVDNSLLTHKDILLQPKRLWPSLTVGGNLESKVRNWLIISPNSFCAKSFFGQDGRGPSVNSSISWSSLCIQWFQIVQQLMNFPNYPHKKG